MGWDTPCVMVNWYLACFCGAIACMGTEFSENRYICILLWIVLYYADTMHACMHDVYPTNSSMSHAIIFIIILHNNIIVNIIQWKVCIWLMHFMPINFSKDPWHYYSFMCELSLDPSGLQLRCHYYTKSAFPFSSIVIFMLEILHWFMIFPRTKIYFQPTSSIYE